MVFSSSEQAKSESHPPVLSYWREFGARYVTALCTRPDGETSSTITHNPSPPDGELAWLALAAPPMTGAEYLTASVLQALWQELHIAFGLELSQSKCGVQEFLKRCNAAWNLVGRVHFNLAENARTAQPHLLFSRRIPLDCRPTPRRNIFR